MNWLQRLFHAEPKKAPAAAQPAQAPAPKPTIQPRAQSAMPGNSSGWSNRVRAALKKAAENDPTAIPTLVDLLFENTIPVVPPTLSDREVGGLLRYANTAPRIEVESIQAAVQYQEWMRDCTGLLSSLRGTLENFPGCALKGEVLDLAIKACGFSIKMGLADSTHSHIHGEEVSHLDLIASKGESESAVYRLCEINTPVTSNLLHKVAGKRSVSLRTGGCTHFSEQTLDFVTEQYMALDELAKRGQPAYDPRAYLTQ